MRVAYEKGGAAAVAYAQACAPYMHPKIAPVEQKVEIALTTGMKTLAELDAMFEQAMRRSEEMQQEVIVRNARLGWDTSKTRCWKGRHVSLMSKKVNWLCPAQRGMSRQQQRGSMRTSDSVTRQKEINEVLRQLWRGNGLISSPLVMYVYGYTSME